MIQDIDGATSEPSRRSHVTLLSAATTAVSLVLLTVLFMPGPRVGTSPHANVPVPSQTAGTVLFYDSGATRVRLDELPPQLLDDKSPLRCAAAIGSTPPVHLVFDQNGHLIAAYTSGRTGRFIALPQAYVSSGWLSVPCDTPDVFAPRLNRAR